MDGKTVQYTRANPELKEPDMFLINKVTGDTVHLNDPGKTIVSESGDRRFYHVSKRH